MNAPNKPGGGGKPRSLTGHPEDFVGPVFYRVCTTCGESKCMFDFSRHAASKFCRNPVCKVCNSAKSRQYHAEHLEEAKIKSKEYRKRNSETLKQRKAEYFQANKEAIVAKRREQRLADPEKNKAFWKAFYAKHRDRLKEEAKARRQRVGQVEKALHRNRRLRYSNPERTSQYQREYRERNLEKLREANRVYYQEVVKVDSSARATREARVRHIGVGGFISWKEFREFVQRARDASKATGVAHTVDHIYPLVSDRVCGLNTPANLRIVTRQVNAAKRNKLLYSLSHEHFAVDPWEVYYDSEEPVNA